MRHSRKTSPLARLNSVTDGPHGEPVIQMEFCDPVPVTSLRKRKRDEGPGFFETLFQLLVIISTAGIAIYTGLLLAPKPLLPIPAGKVYYTPNDVLRMSNLDSYPEKKQTYILDYYSLDLASLYSCGGLPSSPVHQAVNGQCRNASTPDKVFPLRGYDLYDGITRYVVCIMSVRLERFCDATERKRLVSQLNAYSHFRQALLGLERSGSDNYFTRKTRPAIEQGIMREFTEAPRQGQQFSIGEKMDNRVLERLALLVRAGYFSIRDFSFMGLFPPADYAPALKPTGPVKSPACGS